MCNIYICIFCTHIWRYFVKSWLYPRGLLFESPVRALFSKGSEFGSPASISTVKSKMFQATLFNIKTGKETCLDIVWTFELSHFCQLFLPVYSWTSSTASLVAKRSTKFIALWIIISAMIWEHRVADPGWPSKDQNPVVGEGVRCRWNLRDNDMNYICCIYAAMLNTWM